MIAGCAAIYAKQALLEDARAQTDGHSEAVCRNLSAPP